MALFPRILGAACILGIISALPPQKELQLKDVLETMYRKRHDNNVPTQPGFMDNLTGLFVTAVRNFRSSIEQILDSPKASNATSGGNGTENVAVYHNGQQQRVSNGVNRIVKGALEANVAEILRGSVDIPENQQFRNIANRVVDAVFSSGNGTS
ncbi:unnamed protein product [Allacma fusca]|uniref:Uncharacterized protein n=1 Tax=Allacma fusca TaxID=39272 RepID=A0A8J2KYJ6_9HEXA|nr:unnamed protein product [Allacma fusca]